MGPTLVNPQRQQEQAQRANLVVSNHAILAATLEQNAEAKSYAQFNLAVAAEAEAAKLGS